MSEPLKPPRAQMSSWSARIEDRYQCRLSPILADWFDSEAWKLAGRGEYREPIPPESLLAAAPEVIWPGLMGCDLLPLIGNAAGDWLCVRIDQDNVLSEVVQWYHGGGDWIPWGNDLAQGILFDAAIERIPGVTRRHAIPAEAPRPAPSQRQDQGDPLFQWALAQLPREVAGLFQRQTSGQEFAEGMLESRVAEVAVRCELVVSLLTHWPRDILNSHVHGDASVDRLQLSKWSFDRDQIPEAVQIRLREQTGMEAGQDWETAAMHARRVCELAPELAWGWEIAGYAAERRGDVASAVESYRRAATCSVFTDQSVRLDTHWMAPESAKFSVARLKRLRPDEVSQSAYYQILCQPDARRRRQQATDYWMEQATQQTDRGEHRQAHRCYVAAAWDLGADLISTYANLLDHIADSALLSGQPGRAAVARTHRQCLRERYGV